MKNLSRKRGVNLIEILIVAIVLAILAAFTLPTIGILQEDAKRSELKASLKALRGGIAAWHARNGGKRFPTPEELVKEAMPSGTPVNPYNRNNRIAVGKGEIPVNSAGWVYNPKTGEIYSAAAETQGAGF